MRYFFPFRANFCLNTLHLQVRCSYFSGFKYHDCWNEDDFEGLPRIPFWTPVLHGRYQCNVNNVMYEYWRLWRHSYLRGILQVDFIYIGADASCRTKDFWLTVWEDGDTRGSLGSLFVLKLQTLCNLSGYEYWYTTSYTSIQALVSNSFISWECWSLFVANLNTLRWGFGNLTSNVQVVQADPNS